VLLVLLLLLYPTTLLLLAGADYPPPSEDVEGVYATRRLRSRSSVHQTDEVCFLL
jgi:hypothetical protein